MTAKTIEITPEDAKQALKATKKALSKESAADRKKAKEAEKAAEVASFRDRRITKIKLGEPNIIEFARSNENHEDEQAVVKFHEEVHPDLVIKLNQHRDRAIDALCLDHAVWKDGDIIGAAIKWDGLTILGYNLTIKCSMEDFTPTLTTPFLKVEDLWCDQIEVEHLCEEIKDCLDGKRAQGSLFDQAEVEDGW